MQERVEALERALAEGRRSCICGALAPKLPPAPTDADLEDIQTRHRMITASKQSAVGRTTYARDVAILLALVQHERRLAQQLTHTIVGLRNCPVQREAQRSGDDASGGGATS